MITRGTVGKPSPPSLLELAAFARASVFSDDPTYWSNSGPKSGTIISRGGEGEGSDHVSSF